MNKIVLEPQNTDESQWSSNMKLNLVLGDISTRSYGDASRPSIIKPSKEKDLALSRIMTGFIIISCSIGKVSLPLFFKEPEDLRE